MVKRLLMLNLLLCVSGVLGDQAPPIEFPPHPRLAYTAEELTAWKKDPERQKEIERIVRRAETLLQKPLYVPKKGGQWIFYYSCPKHNRSLKPLSLTEHVCPACKRKYTDERTVAAYRTKLQNDLNRNCFQLALAYALTGEDRFAAPVRKALLELVELYPTYERHDRWGRTGVLAVVGGRRYCQHLSEAVGAIELAKAWDLIHNSDVLTDEDRRRIEQDFLGKTMREIQRYERFISARNNHQTWFNGGHAAVGVAIGDKELLKAAVYDPKRGLMWQLGHSITADGLWYEGTIAYHFYALQAILETVEAARRVGWVIKDPRLKRMFLGPIQLAYPNGQFPAINDGDRASLRGYRRFYRWAFEWFDDPVFLPFSGIEGKGGEPQQPVSTALEAAGLVTLRRGTGTDAVCALVDYGIHGGHHGHPDKLNLMLYGLGRELILDPGRLSYRVPEYESWCRTTVAHNTVVVNQRNQLPTTGRLIDFTLKDDFVSTLTATRRAYPGWDMKRFLLLTERWLVDIFSASSKKPAQLDWLVHVRGTPQTTLELAERKEPLGPTNGYQHLAALKTGQGAERLIFDFAQNKDKALRLHLLGDADSTIVIGTGIGYGLNDRVPFLLRRRKTRQALFLTVYDLTGDGKEITEIERVTPVIDGKPAAADDAVALRMQTRGGTYLIAIDLREKAEGESSADGVQFQRVLVDKDQ